METKEFGASPNRVSLRDHGFSRPVLNAKAQDGVRYAHEACDVGGFECAADGRLRRLRIGDDDFLGVVAVQFPNGFVERRTVEHENAAPP